MRRIFRALAAAAILLALSSCGFSGEDAPAQSCGIVSSGSELTMLVAESGEVGKCVRSAAEKYNSECGGNVRIETVSVAQASGAADADQLPADDPVYEEFVRRGGSGSAPDVVLFAAHGDSDASGVYTEWYKYGRGGALAELSEFFPDGKIFGGSGLFVPILYRINMYGGIAEFSADSGAPSPGSFGGFDEFWSQVGDASKYADENGISLFAGSAADVGGADCFELYGGGELIDPSDGGFDSESAAFRAIMREALGGGDFSSAKRLNRVFFDLYNVESGRACMTLSYKNALPEEYLSVCAGYYAVCNPQYGDTPYMSAVPSYGGRGSVAMITLAMGVSDSCADKAEACRFIEFCSKDSDFVSRLRGEDSAYRYDFPADEALLRAAVSDAAKAAALTYIQISDKIYELSESLTAELTDISVAVPYYRPLNLIFARRFSEVSDGCAGMSAEEKLDKLCGLIDGDMREYFDRG